MDDDWLWLTVVRMVLPLLLVVVMTIPPDVPLPPEVLLPLEPPDTVELPELLPLLVELVLPPMEPPDAAAPVPMAAPVVVV